MQDSYICVGGPLQGRSFIEPPAGYHRCAMERGFHQGMRYVWEYDGTDCLDELLAAAVRYGKIVARSTGVERIVAEHVECFTNAEEFSKELDNTPFYSIWHNGERLT